MEHLPQSELHRVAIADEPRASLDNAIELLLLFPIAEFVVGTTSSSPSCASYALNPNDSTPR